MSKSEKEKKSTSFRQIDYNQGAITDEFRRRAPAALRAQASRDRIKRMKAPSCEKRYTLYRSRKACWLQFCCR